MPNRDLHAKQEQTMNIPHKSVTGSLAAALFAISLVATGMSGCGGGDDAVNAAPAG